jgi:hypothetical protein
MGNPLEARHAKAAGWRARRLSVWAHFVSVPDVYPISVTLSRTKFLLYLAKHAMKASLASA